MQGHSPINLKSMAQRICAMFLSAALLAACATPTTLTPTAAPTLPPAPSVTPIPPTPTPVPGLVVNPAQSLGEINPLVYGSNYGPWLFVTLQMRQPAKDAHLTLMRYPGGNWGDQNDLDEWQIDQFIALCKEIGCQPAISVRLRGGTPEKAAALVKMVNVDKGYKVEWWSIGNEPSLYPDYDTVRYNTEWRQFADAMRAVDPKIKLNGPDTHQYTANLATNPKDKNGKDWLEEFLKANGDKVDAVVIHRYAFPGADKTPPTIAQLRENSREWDAIIPALKAQVKQFTGKDLPVGVTEVNSSWSANVGGEATMDSHYNAIWWGDSLGRMIRQGASIVSQFALVGEWGLMGKWEVVPIYYVYRMYQNFGSQLVAARSDDPHVSAFAARRKDGALTVMLVNLEDTPVEKPLRIEGFKAASQVEVWLFDATHKAEKQPSQVLGEKVTLPAQSMTLLVIPNP